MKLQLFYFTHFFSTVSYRFYDETVAIALIYKQKKILIITDEDLKERRRSTLPQIAVPLTQADLTSLFGMGRGEPRRNNHLKTSPLQLPQRGEPLGFGSSPLGRRLGGAYILTY